MKTSAKALIGFLAASLAVIVWIVSAGYRY